MVNAPYLRLALLSLIATAQLGTVSASLRQRDGSLETPAGDAAAPSSTKNLPDDGDEPPLEFPSQPESLIAMQFTSDPYAHRDHTEMIRNGELGLAGIRFRPASFAGDDGQYYAEVHGEFCAFEFSLNREDPAKYPTIADVLSDSEHCGEHSYTMPLREVVQAVSEVKSKTMKQLPVSGLLFHEGHSGAGLISNALTTFDSTLVVSEHSAIRDALGACDVIRNRYKSLDCSPAKQMQLVRDVVSLLSRTNAASNVQHLYLKIPSASAAYLHEMRSLYPDAKWAFVYRGAEHALAKATERKRINACIKASRNPSAALSAKSNEHGVDLVQLTHHRVCALHLSTLLDAATKEHDETGTGMLISYDDHVLSNADAILNVILPYLGLQEDIESNPEVVRDRVVEILSVRSNTSVRINPEDKYWNVAGENIEVTDEVGVASKLYMSDSMDAIMRLRA